MERNCGTALPPRLLILFFSPGDSHRPSISLLFSTVSERKMARVWHALFSLALHFVSAKMSKVTQVHFHDKLCRDKSAESAAGQTSSNHETRHQKKKTTRNIYIFRRHKEFVFFVSRDPVRSISFVHAQNTISSTSASPYLTAGPCRGASCIRSLCFFRRCATTCRRRRRCELRKSIVHEIREGRTS